MSFLIKGLARLGVWFSRSAYFVLGAVWIWVLFDIMRQGLQYTDWFGAGFFRVLFSGWWGWLVGLVLFLIFVLGRGFLITIMFYASLYFVVLFLMQAMNWIWYWATFAVLLFGIFSFFGMMLIVGLGNLCESYLQRHDEKSSQK